jgi:hypothetical protein
LETYVLNKNQKLTHNPTTIDVKSVEIIKHSTWANKYSEQFIASIGLYSYDCYTEYQGTQILYCHTTITIYYNGLVEVIYSKGTTYYYGVAINDDPNSPLSTINRGRKITKRVTNPTITGRPSRQEIENHAKQLLKELSTLEYTVTYTHGYCPVRIGDCVRLNYSRAGLSNVKAKVINQSIECVPGCPVTEKAVFTTELWGW